MCIRDRTQSAHAQTFTNLFNFDGTDGSRPNGLVQAANGDLSLIHISLTPRGKLTTLYSFCSGVSSQYGCLNGEYGTGIAQAANGDFYGTTTTGGASGYGSVFKITHAGVLTTEVSFDDTTDGENPMAGLVQATNGLLYGTTSNGGTVFDITEHGSLTTLIDLNSEYGDEPWGALIQATDV